MDKKIKYFAFLLFMLSSSFVNAQAYLNNLNKQANEMVSAVKKRDYKTLLTFTHPKVVSAMGGNEKAAAGLKASMKVLEDQNINFTKMEVGSVTQSLVSGKTIQCIIPQLVEIQMGTKKAKAKNYLFGISYNGGKNWYFLDTAPLKGDVRKLIPEASKDLIIPKSETTYN